MAYIVIAYALMAYIVMACIVMAQVAALSSMSPDFVGPRLSIAEFTNWAPTTIERSDFDLPFFLVAPPVERHNYIGP